MNAYAKCFNFDRINTINFSLHDRVTCDGHVHKNNEYHCHDSLAILFIAAASKHLIGLTLHVLHLGQGKNEHKLYVEMIEAYNKGTSTMMSG